MVTESKETVNYQKIRKKKEAKDNHCKQKAQNKITDIQIYLIQQQI